MYGTIARMMLKPGREAEMIALMREEETVGIPGDRSTIVYPSDRDPNEYCLAVPFESRAACAANANSAGMHRRYAQYLELLTADPEWHHREVVHSSGKG